MKGLNIQTIRSRGPLLSIASIAAAVLIVLAVSLSSRPSTDDATIDADVVHVAAAVGGRITKLAVRENAFVRKGDVLFQIDPVPYRLSLEQAEANLEVARAAEESQQKLIVTQRATAAVAGEQTRRAQTNYGLASRTTGRIQPLSQQGYVPIQQLDQAKIAQSDAASSLAQARQQAAAAEEAVNSGSGAAAAVKAATAAVALAGRALEDTTVRAPHDGVIVGLGVASGEMVAPGQALFTLVDTEEWFAVANFRETDIERIAIGDCVSVYSMVDKSRPIHGVVDGIGWGVLADDRINLPRSVPYVQPSLNWVRVAQRFPVRVRLENPPKAVARLGASAIVEVRHGPACH